MKRPGFCITKIMQYTCIARVVHTTTASTTQRAAGLCRVMRRVFLFLQLLFSAARRALSPSRAIFPLIRIIVALKQFVRGCFKSPEPSPGVSTSPRLPESRSTTPQQLIQSPQVPDHCMPSLLPAGLHGQHALLPQHPTVVPDTALRVVPVAPGWFERYRHRRPVYVVSLLC